MEYSGAASDPEWLAMINSSLAEEYEILISKKDLGYYESEYLFTVTGSDGYALPADFKELLALDYQDGSAWVSLQRFTNNARNNGGSAYGSGKQYRITQAGIKLLPSESAQGTYRLSYIPRYAAKTSLSDEIGDLEMDNWHEYVIVDCAIKFLTKQETDCQVFIGQKTALLERINRSAGQRDAGSPFRLGGCSEDIYYDGTPRRY